jgi:hypothetical protein
VRRVSGTQLDPAIAATLEGILAREMEEVARLLVHSGDSEEPVTPT